MSAGFAMTPTGDIDVNTLVEGEDTRVLAAAITVALQTFLGEWRGNLRIGIDRAAFQLRDAEDIKATVEDGCRRALAGLCIIDTLTIAFNTTERSMVVNITAHNGETSVTLEIPLL